MALHDVDKSSDNRALPMPNMSDASLQRPAEGTRGVQNKLAFKETQNFSELLQVPQTAQVSIAAGDTLSWTTIPHGLDFTPDVKAYLDNASIGSVTSSGRLPLPTWVGLDLSGSDVVVTAHLSAFADSTNVYVLLIKGASGGAVGTLTVTYYLERGILR